MTSIKLGLWLLKIKVDTSVTSAEKNALADLGFFAFFFGFRLKSLYVGNEQTDG